MLDTCLVYYTLENRGKSVPRKVGLRVMLDTFMAPTTASVRHTRTPGLLTTMKDFSQKELPDYIEALEKPDLNHPGTVAHLDLKGISLRALNWSRSSEC